MLASNPALEALVRANDDEASWQVLEDWLLETDDPRARLVRLEKAGEDSNTARMELGPQLFASAHLAFVASGETWRAGFARTARIAATDHALAARPLVQVPAFALLRSLAIRAREGVFVSAAFEAAKFGAQLESLVLQYDGIQVGTLDTSILAPLSQLESLALAGGELQTVYAEYLGSLKVLDLALAPRTVSGLLRPGRFEALGSLTVRTGTLIYPWHGVFDALLEGTCAPRLHTLHVEAAGTSASVDFLRDLARSPLAERLRTLTFAGTECSPEALRRLGRSIASVHNIAL